jgi:anti-anti-sigma regulatory factor
MKITISKTGKSDSVTVLQLDGILDSTNYQSLLDEAHNVYTADNRDLLLDLSNLTFISSAGLGALHQVALLFRGEKQAEGDESWSDYRWTAFHGSDSGHNRGSNQNVKLLSPTKEVRGVLDLIGFSSFFEIFTDFNQAVASFYHTVPVETHPSTP